MTVADRIGVMDDGRLVQVATPPEIYEQPNSRWVADFIGDVNLFEGTVVDVEAGRRRRSQAPAAGACASRQLPTAKPGDTVWVALRPEKIAHRTRAAGRGGRELRRRRGRGTSAISATVSIYKVRARRRRRHEGGASPTLTRLDRAADRLGRPRLADLGAGRRRGADAIERWRRSSRARIAPRSWGARLVVLIPYLWLAAFFLVPFLIVLKISLSQTAIAQPPYTPVLDLGRRLAGR